MPSNTSIAKSCKVVTIRTYDPGTLMTGTEYEAAVCSCGGHCESRGRSYLGAGNVPKRAAICQECGANYSLPGTYPGEPRKI